MITNSEIYKITQIPLVLSFVQRFHMKWQLCGHSLIIFSLPYAILVTDALIENYLEIYFLDLNRSLRVSGGAVIEVAVQNGSSSAINQIGLSERYTKNEQAIFISEQKRKLDDLYEFFGALNELFPQIEREGFSALAKYAVTFNSATRDQYLKCIDDSF
jgi:hypothetical protein